MSVLSSIEAGVASVAGTVESTVASLATAAGLKKAEADVEDVVQDVAHVIDGPIGQGFLALIDLALTVEQSPAFDLALAAAGVSGAQIAAADAEAVIVLKVIKARLTAAQAVAKKVADSASSPQSGSAQVAETKT